MLKQRRLWLKRSRWVRQLAHAPKSGLMTNVTNPGARYDEDKCLSYLGFLVSSYEVSSGSWCPMLFHQLSALHYWWIILSWPELQLVRFNLCTFVIKTLSLYHFCSNSDRAFVAISTRMSFTLNTAAVDHQERDFSYYEGFESHGSVFAAQKE